MMDYLRSNYPSTQVRYSKNCRMAIIEGITLSTQQKKKLRRFYEIRHFFSFKSKELNINFKNTPEEVKKISYYPFRNLYRFELNIKPAHEMSESLYKLLQNSTLGEPSSGNLVTLLTKKQINETSEKNNERINRSPIQFLTLDEIKEVDKTLAVHPDVCRRPEIGAISKFDISEDLIKRHHSKVLRILQKIVPSVIVETIGFFKQITLRNVFLRKEVVEVLHKNSAYSHSLHLLNFEIRQDVFQKFLRERQKKKIMFMSEDNSDFHGLVLPDPIENSFLITMPSESSISQLRFRAFWFYAVLKKFFPKESISFHHEHIFKINKRKFYDYLSTQALAEEYQINLKLQTIAFDFYDEEDFRKKLEVLKNYELIDLYGFSDIHRYKVIFTPKMAGEPYEDDEKNQRGLARSS